MNRVLAGLCMSLAVLLGHICPPPHSTELQDESRIVFAQLRIDMHLSSLGEQTREDQGRTHREGALPRPTPLMGLAGGPHHRLGVPVVPRLQVPHDGGDAQAVGLLEAPARPAGSEEW